MQWMATADAPPDPTKIIPGVLTVWKLRTQAASLTMNDFSVMKTAFPDEYNRRLKEEVARNYLRNGNTASVYYFSDAQLGTLLSDREKERFAAMMADWRLLIDAPVDPKGRGGMGSALQQDAQQFAALAWRRPLAKDEADDLAAVYSAGARAGISIAKRRARGARAGAGIAEFSFQAGGRRPAGRAPPHSMGTGLAAELFPLVFDARRPPCAPRRRMAASSSPRSWSAR